MSNFWKALGNPGADRTASNLDQFLSGAVDKTIKPKKLAEQNSVQKVALPVATGTRVHFAANLQAMLTYPDLPADKTAGVVVTVRTASGDTNTHDGRVFVAFQDGTFGAFYPEHLRYASNTRTASAVSRRVASLGDLSDFLRPKQASSDLIHKATRDLWSFKKDADGYILERLFDDDGSPIKV